MPMPRGGGWLRRRISCVGACYLQRVQAGLELGYTKDDIAAGAALKAQVEALPSPA